MDEYHYIYTFLGLVFAAVSSVALLIWEMLKSQLRFKAICENSGSLVIIGKALSGKHGKIYDIEIVGCNEVYARHLGKNVDDVIGMRITRDFFDGVEPEWLDLVRDVVSTRESRQIEFSYAPRGKRYSGSIFSLSSIRKRCCFIIEDKTAEYKRKCELARVRNMMDMILEMSGIAMWEWNLQTDNINIINASTKIVAEYKQQDINLNDLMEKIHPDDRLNLIAFKNNLPAENRPASPAEYRMKDRQGEWRWFQAVAVKVNYSEANSSESLIGVAFDIDSLKRSQLKVEKISKEFEINQKWLMFSLQQSRTGYCRWDVETDEFYLSDNFWQSVCGLTPEEEASRKSPRTIREFQDLMVVENPIEVDNFMDSVRTGYPDEISFRCSFSFVPDRCLEVRTNVLERDGQGRAKVMSAFIIDISEMRKKEDALRAAMEAADEANKAKGRFLAVMSHEIRTPLNAIIGFSSMLQNSDIPGRLKSYAESIRNSGEMLLYLINDLLDLAKIESSKMELKFEPVNLFDLLHEIKGMFDFKVKSRNLFLDLHCDVHLPKFNMDPRRIQQVLVNLIGNAVKFTNEGGITVDVSAKPLESFRPETDASSLYRLVISVTDTGMGIREEDCERIFNPFEQAARNHRNYVDGTGLGLAICRNLVQLMGGTLTVKSKEGRGSSFIAVFNEIEAATGLSSYRSIKKVLPGEHVEADETDESIDMSTIPGEVIDGIHSTFGDCFANMMTGLHVKSARTLIKDLNRWMKDNNAYEIKEIVDLLQQAVNDYDVTKVRRIVSLLVKRSDEND
ncbi:MAG: ATP-binding protein [Kiritimatiellia bacterium]